jgi:hypothetical protein
MAWHAGRPSLSAYVCVCVCLCLCLCLCLLPTVGAEPTEVVVPLVPLSNVSMHVRKNAQSVQCLSVSVCVRVYVCVCLGLGLYVCVCVCKGVREEGRHRHVCLNGCI